MQGTWMVLLALILGTFGELGEHWGSSGAAGIGVPRRENVEPELARWAEASTKALGASGEPQDTGMFANTSL